jgi:iron complex outermembrane receptor protein
LHSRVAYVHRWHTDRQGSGLPIGDFETRYTDLAAFGEFTWHFAPAWSLTGGGARYSDRRCPSRSRRGCCSTAPAYVANETQSDSWRKALWKVNLPLTRIDATSLAYATWSQGFRRGAVNALPPN